MPDVNTETVILAFLFCWVARFGVPVRITTDRGGQFTSQLFSTMMQRLGIEHHLTTSWHPAANGLVERLHRQLKAAIMCHEDESWMESLPLVLLGIRTAFKDDMASTSAELVYGEPLRLPGELVVATTKAPTSDVTELLGRLQQHFGKVRPIPASRHAKPGVFIHRELANCTHVLLRTDATRRALEPPYTGPYRVIRRDAKTVELDIQGRHPTVSIDRVKPAFLLADDAGEPRQPSKHPPASGERPPARQPTTPPGPSGPAPGQAPEVVTRAGRRVRFTDRYAPGSSFSKRGGVAT